MGHFEVQVLVAKILAFVAAKRNYIKVEVRLAMVKVELTIQMVIIDHSILGIAIIVEVGIFEDHSSFKPLDLVLQVDHSIQQQSSSPSYQ